MRVKDSELICLTDESHPCCFIEGNEARHTKLNCVSQKTSFISVFLALLSLASLAYLPSHDSKARGTESEWRNLINTSMKSLFLKKLLLNGKLCVLDLLLSIA